MRVDIPQGRELLMSYEPPLNDAIFDADDTEDVTSDYDTLEEMEGLN